MKDQRDSLSAEDTAGEKRRILLVEDNLDDLSHIQQMIEDGDTATTVVPVSTGPAAIAEFSQNGADCVILDYRLETEDGLDILVQLKGISPFVPVIMLTGQGNEEIAAESIKVGASDYLIKQRLNETYLRTSIENALSRAALEAKIAEQEQDRVQFLNVLVHDLRAPLRHLRQLGETAMEEAEVGDYVVMKSLLNSQSIVAARANDLIGTLEDFALLDREPEIEMVCLADMAEAAVHNLQPVITEKNATIDIGPLPGILGNGPQLVQMFQNLIGNGLKYNQSPNPHIDIQSKDGVGAGVVVQDNGIGIAAQYFKDIFMPLKRLWTAETYDGTGLGLAICRKVVARHGGKIWCTSEEGKGSQFHIVFPTK